MAPSMDSFLGGLSLEILGVCFGIVAAPVLARFGSPWAYCLLETTAHTPIVSCCASNQANESLAPENDVGIASVRTLVALRRRRTIEVAKIGIQAFLGRK